MNFKEFWRQDENYMMRDQTDEYHGQKIWEACKNEVLKILKDNLTHEQDLYFGDIKRKN